MAKKPARRSKRAPALPARKPGRTAGRRQSTRRSAAAALPSLAVPPPSLPALSDLEAVLAARDLFWHNVVRDMLTSLSMMQMQGAAEQLFDGRISVLTNGGERIPIGVVFPMFACSIPGAGRDHQASIAVECTVFRIQTPMGEVYTIPVHEIRGLVSLTEGLIKELEQASMNRVRPDGEAPGPFGFAAFLPRGSEAGTENGQGAEKPAEGAI